MSKDSGDGAKIGCLAKDMAGFGDDDNGDWMRMSIVTEDTCLQKNVQQTEDGSSQYILEHSPP